MVLVAFEKMLRHFNAFLDQSLDTPLVMYEAILIGKAKFEEQLINNPNSKLLLMGLFLDPTCKFQKSVFNIKCKYSAYARQVVQDICEVHIKSLKPPKPIKAKLQPSKSFFAEPGSEEDDDLFVNTNSDEETDAFDEFQLYAYSRCAPETPKGTNILDYWVKLEIIYPDLAILARKYLSIPATSASAKRGFSFAKHYLPLTRNCLSVDHTEDSVLIGNWAPFFKSFRAEVFFYSLIYHYKNLYNFFRTHNFGLMLPNDHIFRRFHFLTYSLFTLQVFFLPVFGFFFPVFTFILKNFIFSILFILLNKLIFKPLFKFSDNK